MFKWFGHARRRSTTWIFGTMLVSSALSLIASLVLSIDALEILKNPDAVLSCDINAVISCATVMKHASADLLGFPNSFIGMMAEPVVMTIAVAGLIGVRFPRPFMLLAQLGYTAGLVFAYYLFLTSVFVIGALCPWCLLVTISTTLVFVSLLHFNIREDNLYLSPKQSAKMKAWIKKGYDRFVTAILIAAMVFLILFKYSDGLFG